MHSLAESVGTHRTAGDITAEQSLSGVRRNRNVGRYFHMGCYTVPKLMRARTRLSGAVIWVLNSSSLMPPHKCNGITDERTFFTKLMPRMVRGNSLGIAATSKLRFFSVAANTHA